MKAPQRMESLLIFGACFLLLGSSGCVTTGAYLPSHIQPIRKEGNLAYNARVSASSVYTHPVLGLNFEPSGAVDGIIHESHYPETIWLLPDATTGYITIDLPESSILHKLRILNVHNIHFYDRGTKGFHVEIVTPDNKVMTVWRDYFANLGIWKEKNLDGILAKQIIIHVDSYFTYGGGLNEIEIYGEPLSATRVVALSSPTWELENIAVADLKANALSKGEADTLSDKLRAALVQTHYFRVLSNRDMNEVLQQQNFQQSDYSDDTQRLVEMGRILAVQKIVGGSIGRVGLTFHLSIRMVNVETAEIEFTAERTFKGAADELINLIEDAGLDLCSQYAQEKSRH